jgi:hypothetical protein
MNTNDAWLHLRASLAHPPVMRGKGRDRRIALYEACVLQFEEMVKASVAIAPHARPLPLYYAAMIASKALIAVASPMVAVRGHGLRQASRTIPRNILDFEVAPVSGASVFAELCQLLGCSLPTRNLQLRAVFLSLPDLSAKPVRLEGHRACLVEAIPRQLRYDPIPDPLMRILIETPALPTPSSLFSIYPSLRGWHEENPNQSALTSRGRAAAVCVSDEPIDYRDRLERLNQVAPFYRFSGEHWLRPAVAGQIAPLPTWYSLLFGFSVLARYEPDSWVAALRPHRAEAVPVESALEEATHALPELLWKEIEPLMVSGDTFSGSNS